MITTNEQDYSTTNEQTVTDEGHWADGIIGDDNPPENRYTMFRTELECIMEDILQTQVFGGYLNPHQAEH